MKSQNEIQSDEIDQLELETLDAIQKGESNKVLDLYLKVEQLFEKGTDYSRSLIANKFIYPLSTLLEMNYSWGRKYLEMFPCKIKTEYYKQIYSSGV